MFIIGDVIDNDVLSSLNKSNYILDISKHLDIVALFPLNCRFETTKDGERKAQNNRYQTDYKSNKTITCESKTRQLSEQWRETSGNAEIT